MARLLGEHGIPKDSPAGRRVFEQRWRCVGRRRTNRKPGRLCGAVGAWGAEAFRKELLAQVSEQRGAHHYGAELREGEEAKPERLVQEELARAKWAETNLAAKPKTHRQKARVALRLRRKTTMTLAWIARRLKMGSVNMLKNTLCACQ